MANVLNRITRQYIESVNTPDYDEGEWIINPDLTAVKDLSIAYWLIDGDGVVPMPEKDRASADLWMPYKGLNLVEAREKKKQMVNAERDVHSNGGWIYQGITYDSDAISKQNISGIMTLVNTGYVLPSTFTFRSAHNEDISFNNATFTVFFQCSCVWAEMIYRTSWYHKAYVDSLPDIPSVASYNVTLGWPTGYSG